MRNFITNDITNGSFRTNKETDQIAKLGNIDKIKEKNIKLKPLKSLSKYIYNTSREISFDLQDCKFNSIFKEELRIQLKYKKYLAKKRKFKNIAEHTKSKRIRKKQMERLKKEFIKYYITYENYTNKTNKIIK